MTLDERGGAGTPQSPAGVSRTPGITNLPEAESAARGARVISEAPALHQGAAPRRLPGVRPTQRPAPPEGRGRVGSIPD